MDRKIIEREFEGFMAACFDGKVRTGSPQHTEMRNAFFAGYRSLLSMMMNKVDPGDEITETDVELMLSIEDELTVFEANILKSPVGPQ